MRVDIFEIILFCVNILYLITQRERVSPLLTGRWCNPAFYTQYHDETVLNAVSLPILKA